MYRKLLIIIQLLLCGVGPHSAQTTFKGGQCGRLKWHFIGSYRSEGENLKSTVILRTPDTTLTLYPNCKCDSSFMIPHGSHLVASRTVIDLENSTYDTLTKLRTFHRKEVFRDSIVVDEDDPDVVYHFWLDKEQDWFKIPPKEDIGWFYVSMEINYNSGFGFSPGVGIILESDVGHSTHALFGISLNGELNRNQQQWIYGYKLQGEVHFAELFNVFVPLGAKVGFWQCTNGSTTANKLTTEAGFSLLGLVYVMAGYNFNLNKDTFSTLGGWRFSVGFRKDFFIERIRKDAKYNSNLTEQIKQL